MIKKSIFSLLTLLALPALSDTPNTQQTTATKNMLEKSAELALDNDLDLLASDTKREIAKEGILQAEATRWPTIGLVANSSASFLESKSVQRRTQQPPQGSGRLTAKGNSIKQQASVGLELNQELYTGGRIEADIETAKLTDILEETRYKNTQSSSVFTLIKTILNILESRAILKVALEKRTLLERRAENMQIRADYGLENITSLESVKAKAEAAKADYEARKTALEISEKSYEMLTGVPLTDSIEDIDPTGLPDSFDLVKEIGLKNNYQLREKDLLADVESQRVKREEAQLYPKLSLSASVGKAYAATQNASTKSKTDWGRENAVTVGLRLNVPIDYTGFTHSRVRSARYVHAQKRLDEINARRQYVLKLYSLWKSYKTADANQKKYLAQIKAANLSLEAVQEQYNAGTVGYLNILESINEAAEANYSYIRNKKSALENAYEILYQIGKLTGSFGEKIQESESVIDTERPYWDLNINDYGAFGWKKDPILDKIKFENND